MKTFHLYDVEIKWVCWRYYDIVSRNIWFGRGLWNAQRTCCIRTNCCRIPACVHVIRWFDEESAAVLSIGNENQQINQQFSTAHKFYSCKQIHCNWLWWSSKFIVLESPFFFLIRRVIVVHTYYAVFVLSLWREHKSWAAPSNYVICECYHVSCRQSLCCTYTMHIAHVARPDCQCQPVLYCSHTHRDTLRVEGR